MAPDEAIVVYVTVPSVEDGARIGRALVEDHLAACVNVVPQVRSIYRWKDKLCDDTEALIVVKTRRARFDALATRVRELHSYDVPEIIALPVVAGHDAYLQWLDEATA